MHIYNKNYLISNIYTSIDFFDCGMVYVNVSDIFYLIAEGTNK